MIKATNLSYSVPGKDLYNNISFTLEDGVHCAFIGSNGTGKSTLAHILMDPEEYMYDGKLQIEQPCRIGYVSQFMQVEQPEEVTVFEYLSEDFRKIEADIEAICTEMGTTDDLDSVMERYQQVLDTFQSIDGDNYENNITKQLNLADLSKHKDQKISNLSGGEFKLIQVIRELLTAPDLMIMDEPDVFLDFEHLNALRNLINYHKGTMLVITHNRYLLNHCFNKILHLENKEVQEFDGRYMEYNFFLLQTKIELMELSIADTEEIERQKKLVEKLRAEATYFTDAARGRSLKARVSLLERLEARRIKAPFVDIPQPDINLVTDKELEEDIIVLEVKDYSVGFEEMLLEHVDFSIKAHEKVALIGANGTGKTTLLHQILENNKESIRINEEVQLAYLSQAQGEMLDESNTIQQEYMNLGFPTYDDAAEYLAKYGFEGEELHKKISALSGGEKNLLQLAKISISNANLLLLDEPTSHLDTYSQIALEEAIADYNGAILMISHDFYTIANCMDYVLLIEDKTVRKMSIRKFRKMIYANHFEMNYLELEQQKKEIETKIALALKESDFEKAKTLTEKLEEIIKSL